MDKAEKLEKLKRLKELRDMKAAKEAELNFFDPRRYALENIPANKEQMISAISDPNAAQQAAMKDLALGAMGTSSGISKAINVPNADALNLLKLMGKKVYQSAFKEPDKVTKMYGKKPVSDIFFEKGFTGTTGKALEVGENLIDDLVKQQRQILADIDKAVPEANLDEALMPLKNKIDELRASRDPVKIQAADALAEDLATYQSIKATNPAPITPSQMSAMKTSAQNVLPKTAYSQEIAKMNPIYMQGKKALGAGLRQEVQRVAEQASPELGQSLLGVNTDLSSLLSAGKALSKEASKGMNKNMLTSVDPMVAALGQTSGAALPALAGKKAADLSKTTLFRTNLGRGLYELGDRSPEAAASLWYFLDKETKGE